jgi:hypothetical protein
MATVLCCLPQRKAISTFATCSFSTGPKWTLKTRYYFCTVLIFFYFLFCFELCQHLIAMFCSLVDSYHIYFLHFFPMLFNIFHYISIFLIHLFHLTRNCTPHWCMQLKMVSLKLQTYYWFIKRKSMFIIKYVIIIIIFRFVVIVIDNIIIASVNIILILL